MLILWNLPVFSDVSLFKENINTGNIKNSIEIFLQTSKEMCIEVNTDKSKYMNMTQKQKQQQSHTISS